MIKLHIVLERYDWDVFCFFAVTHYDTDEIMAYLEDADCEPRYAQEAYRNLRDNSLNSGLTYTSTILHRSIIVTAITDSADEFFNSLTHELCHCATHIANAMYINRDAEEFAYFMGDLSMAIFPHVKHLLCDCCREKQKAPTPRDALL